MTLAPLIDAGPAILTHAAAAVLAAVLGPVAILRRRRDRLHRRVGYAWVGAMAITSISALGINEIRLLGPFSPIHLLIGLVLVNLWRGIAAARAGRVVEHGRTLVQSWIWTMGLAGAFTLLPGRRMNEALFGGESWAGFVLGVAVLATVSLLLWRAQPHLPGPRPRRNPLFFARPLG